MPRYFPLFAICLLAACADRMARADDPVVSEAAGVVDSAAADSPTVDVAALPSVTPDTIPPDRAVADTAPAPLPVSVRDTSPLPVVRGLYLNRFVPQSGARLRSALAIADSTMINAVVVDMKDELGLNYRSADPALRQLAGEGHGRVGNVRAVVDSIKAHGLLPIARIVVFKDPVAASINEDWTIRQEDGSVWRDKQDLVWVNPYHPEVREYNLKVAEELVRLGFEEIQWDYIRFPEPYQSLPAQVFPGADRPAPDILARFLEQARARLAKYNVRSTADVFGLTTSVRGALEVGQNWDKLSAVADVILPMVYPSHYPSGAYGVQRPNAEPYTIVKTALDHARRRDSAAGITQAEHVRPWLQAFTIGRPDYGPEQITQQIQATYDAGYNGWILWHPGSRYEVFVPALIGAKPCTFVFENGPGSARCVP